METTLDPGAAATQRFIELLKNNHGGNAFRVPMSEVDQEQLAWTPFGSSTPVHTQYGYASIDEQMEQGTFLIYADGRGIFLSRTYDGKFGGGRPTPKLKIRFWRFGCQHDMKQTRNLGRCYNEFTCTHCGHKENVDSGD